jgi:hypothetical protein
MGKPFYFNQV